MLSRSHTLFQQCDTTPEPNHYGSRSLSRLPHLQQSKRPRSSASLQSLCGDSILIGLPAFKADRFPILPRHYSQLGFGHQSLFLPSSQSTWADDYSITSRVTNLFALLVQRLRVRVLRSRRKSRNMSNSNGASANPVVFFDLALGGTFTIHQIWQSDIVSLKSKPPEASGHARGARENLYHMGMKFYGLKACSDLFHNR